MIHVILYTEVEVEFTEIVFPVSEDDTAPGVQVCIRIVAGTVDSDGLVIDIVNTDDGSATGEC